ncbi:MAG: CAP domain-containing protein [Schleiferiaceae bacterium]|nr:CAP domain-containing protein [Schleiferiaceae bacterium]
MIRLYLLLACITFGREALPQNPPGPAVYTEAFSRFRERPAVQRRIKPDEHPHWCAWLKVAIHHYTNAARSRNNRTPLAPAAPLDSAAGHYADLLRDDYNLSHRYPKAKWRHPADRIAYWGGDYRGTAENLARLPLWDLGPESHYQLTEKGQYQLPSGQPVLNRSYADMAQNVVQGWMDSSGHRANLLGSFTHLGLGVARWARPSEAPPQVIIVQNFGKP